jgi:hypothetical protein
MKRTLAILLLALFVVSVTAAAVAANQAQSNQGYRDGCRTGYIDGFREGKADSKKTATAFIKKTVTKNDYDRSYERGYSDCFPRGYAAGLKVKVQSNQETFILALILLKKHNEKLSYKSRTISTFNGFFTFFHISSFPLLSAF